MENTKDETPSAPASCSATPSTRAGYMQPLYLIEELTRQGGSIVSSNDCSELEIREAQGCNRFAVDDGGFGFVLRPKLTTSNL